MTVEDLKKKSKEESDENTESLKDERDLGIFWEEKTENVQELCKKKLPVIKESKNKQILTKRDSSTNILIEGDNYHALSVLNYTHKEKIDVIYIDPPYNTGAKDWKYNNNYVTLEDDYRHSRWLSFMDKRLRLAKNLLAKDGIICCTIDDNELPKLWLLMEKIFHEKHHLGTIVIRNNPGGRKSKKDVALQHEYALFFSISDSTKIKPIKINPENKTHAYKKDENGEWYEERNLRKDGADSRATSKSERYYPIYYDPKTKKLSTKKKYKTKILPHDKDSDKRIWRRADSEIDKLSKNGEIFVKKTKYGLQVYFKFRGGLEGETPKSLWLDTEFSASEHGTRILNEILGKREAFEYPKSPYATAECIKAASDKKNSIILDFFGGSGTTGHAVLELNKEDGGNRKFILCTNNENKICTQVCYPRIKKVMNGYTNSKKKKIKGLGVNLKYFKTDFVDAKNNRGNIKKLAQASTEMLCLKEDCLDPVLKKKDFRVFGNPSGKIMCIIDDYPGLKPCIDFINKIKSKIPEDEKINVYEFSLGNSMYQADFDKAGLGEDLVNLIPFPVGIKRTYEMLVSN